MMNNVTSKIPLNGFIFNSFGQFKDAASINLFHERDRSGEGIVRFGNDEVVRDASRSAVVGRIKELVLAYQRLIKRITHLFQSIFAFSVPKSYTR